jgi:PAS domain S-box-containing protein
MATHAASPGPGEKPMQPSPQSAQEHALDFGVHAPRGGTLGVPWLRRALLLLALACSFQLGVSAQVKEVRRVLIFYELGLSSPGVELVDRGIRDALQNSTYQIELYREYLETTLFPDAASQQEIRQWFLHKYRDIKPDLIIAGGPSSLRFVLASHEQSFRGVPIVFCGTSEELADYPQLDSHFTGIWEKFEAAKTLVAALRLQPDTKHVVVIGGTTSLDRHLEALVQKDLVGYESKFDITYLTDLTMSELLEKVRHLPNHTVVLLTDVAEDAAGTKFVGSTQAAPIVIRATNAPVFSLTDVDLGHGEVGGDITSFAREGQTAGEMALRILKGEKPQDIPILKGTNVYMFDWRALQHWGLSETRLPVGSAVVNKPPNIWEAYKRYILAGSCLLVLQALIIVGLLWQRASRRKAEAALRESEGRFRLVANTAPVMIWMSGKDKRCIYFNQPWLAFTGRSPGQELGDGWTEGIHAEDLKARLDDYNAAFDRGEPFQVEYRLRRHDGEYRWIFDYGVPRFNADGSLAGYIGSATDVTERKRAEEALSTVSRRLIEAQEEERSWIARELHDDINQRIAMLSINLDSLQRDLSGSEVQARSRVEETERQLKELGSDIQALSHRLHSSKLDILGLAAACRGFCRELSERHSVEIEFYSEGIPKNLSNEISLCLFRVVQEALQNAVKHSGVREFQVWLNGACNRIELTVHDSGSGFDPESALVGDGLGLTSMKERLKLVNGRLSIDSKPGHGTTIHAHVPLSPETMPLSSEGRQQTPQHITSP